MLDQWVECFRLFVTKQKLVTPFRLVSAVQILSGTQTQDRQSMPRTGESKMSTGKAKSEMLALFDWRHIITNTTEKWRSAEDGGPTASFICGSYELIQQSDTTSSDEAGIHPALRKPLHRSEITLNLKQRNPQPNPRSEDQGHSARRAKSVVDVRHAGRDSLVEKKSELIREQDFSHRRHSMDVSLAKLRREMVSEN